MHLVPEVPGGTVVLSYDTVLGTFGGGGWRAAAELYKRWAKTQPWTAKLLSDRQDIPAILLAGAPAVVAGIQDAAGYSGHTTFGDKLEKLPGYLARYKQQMATKRKPRMLFVPYGWENRGTWAGINYFPAQPTNEAWRTANTELNNTGDGSMFLVSGSWWVVKRNATNGGPAFDDSAQSWKMHAWWICW
jgi:hypothetical protein